MPEDAGLDKRARVAARRVADNFWRDQPPRQQLAPPGYDTIARTAHAVANELFPGATMASTSPDEPVLVRLSGGRRLSLQVLPAGSIQAQASGSGDCHQAIMTQGLAHGVFELAASLWTNADFMPAFHPIDGLAHGEDNGATPRGLDGIARARHARMASTDREPMPVDSGRFLSMLAGVRRAGFEHSLREALRFVWLHEVAHVLGRHLELAAQAKMALEAIDEVDDDAGTEPVAAAKPRRAASAKKINRQHAALRALEIEADRWALNHLLRQSAQRAATLHLDVDTPVAWRLTMMGALIVMTVFHAQRRLFDRDAPLRTHPPLWFRAADVRDAVRHMRLRLDTAADATPSIERDARRFREDHADTDALLRITDIHPMFGEWLGPLANDDHPWMQEELLDEARSALQALLSNSARPKPFAIDNGA